MKIHVYDYPANFQFEVKSKLPAKHLTKKRTEILHKAMKRLGIESPSHDYRDYIVEIVVKTHDGEIWLLGS